ncbi:colicin-like pore-forming protein [Rosenbergiella epipactidis]|uniref:colicin-like pore-forming protein n=1 Tax=Rosenbergiella epipactidis TaxID=1544694 RepID=UPI001F4E138F|nr:colicin-like pore-forming protein [Rosenbergiella epipactidis]
MTEPVSFKGGVPYDANGYPIIYITGGNKRPSLAPNSSGVGMDSFNMDGVNQNFGMGLVTNPNSVSQHIDPLAFAANVPQIHHDELLAQMQEADDRQKQLDATLSQAQTNSINAFNEMVTKLNSSPQERAQAFVNYQNMLVHEMNAKIASENNAADYISADIMFNNGRIWFKTSDEDAAEVQRYNDARAIDEQKVRDLASADEESLSQLNTNKVSPEQEEADIVSAMQFVSEFYDQVFKKYGDKAKSVAENLANRAKGKRIRNASEAMAAFNKYQQRIDDKFSQADRQAIVNALAAMNMDEISKNLARFSKAFSVLGFALNAIDLRNSLEEAIKTGNYNQFFLKVEALMVGYYVSELVAFSFAILTGSAIGILGFGVWGNYGANRQLCR